MKHLKESGTRTKGQDGEDITMLIAVFMRVNGMMT